MRSNRVCRHFLQGQPLSLSLEYHHNTTSGKCSWGRECRFSHGQWCSVCVCLYGNSTADDEALPGRPHPPPPYGARERLLEPHLVGPLEPGFMRLPPPGERGWVVG